MEGAEAFSATGGADGVLVLHGFTGNPSSMRAIAERLADAGLTVELPRLPGHGTVVTDLVALRWDDWADAAEAAYRALAARCATVAAVGLSMGGTLALWLAERHPVLCGLVVVNPLVVAPGAELRDGIGALLADGLALAPGIGSDIADPEVAEITYDGTPLEAVLSLFDAADAVSARLGEVTCPVLLFSSREDHVVEPTSGDRLEEAVGGPIERVWLERSFHVATLDYDHEEIEERTTAFVAAVTAGAR